MSVEFIFVMTPGRTELVFREEDVMLPLLRYERKALPICCLA